MFALQNILLYSPKDRYIFIGIYLFNRRKTMPTQVAKIFMNGRSQAVRLPKEYRFDTDEVYITRKGKNIIISPKEPTWDEFFDSNSVFDNDFLKDRADTQPQERDFD